MKIIIVTAAYNEKDNIGKLITLVEEDVFPEIKNHEMHLLVADDTSPDGTADVVREYIKKYTNLHLNSGPKKGLGAAYIRSMSYAIEELNADLVISIDADLQHDPRAIPAFIKKIEQGYDLVSGTRYSKGGSMPKNWPLHRKLFSITANTLLRIITGRFYLHDWTGGFRAITKEVFLKERAKTCPFQGYTFQVAFLYKALLDGYKAGEVPIHFHSRTLGDSKIVPLEYIINLLKYVISERIYEKKRFVKFLVVGTTGFIVQFISQELSILVGIGHTIATGIGAEGAILSNFSFNHLWTFGDTKHIKESHNAFLKLIKFNITSIGSIFVQMAAVWIAESMYGHNIKLLSLTIPTRFVVLVPTIVIIVIPLNYLIYNKIIWKTQYLKK